VGAYHFFLLLSKLPSHLFFHLFSTPSHTFRHIRTNFFTQSILKDRANSCSRVFHRNCSCGSIECILKIPLECLLLAALLLSSTSFLWYGHICHFWSCLKVLAKARNLLKSTKECNQYFQGHLFLPTQRRCEYSRKHSERFPLDFFHLCRGYDHRSLDLCIACLVRNLLCISVLASPQYLLRNCLA